MNKIVKRMSAMILSFILVLSCLLPAVSVFAGDSKNKLTADIPNKYINIVIDDSGSMVNGDGTQVSDNPNEVKCWARAKYSLEAFVAMLSDGDKMNVYTLNQGLLFQIDGSKKKAEREKVHDDFQTGDNGAGTKIDNVDKAERDLVKIKNKGEYDPWLVVITDGDFENYKKDPDGGKKNTTAKFAEYGKDLDGNVVFITINKDMEYTGDQFNYYDAQDTKDANSDKSILNTVKKAINDVYASKRNEVPSDLITLNGNTATVKMAGVSMKELVIFAQGEGVKEPKLSLTGYKSDTIPVKYTDPENAVKYNTKEESFKDHPNVILTDKTLEGIVTTVKPSQNGGLLLTKPNKDSDGSFDIIFEGNAPKNISVYFEPSVHAEYKLVDSNNNEINEKTPCISPGTYTLFADIYDDGTGEKITQEYMDPKFEITIDGTTYTLDQLRNGVPITFSEKKVYTGEDINVEATILNDKYKVETDDILKGLVVKDTYNLEIKYQLPEKFCWRIFKKSNFVLNSLDDITTDKKEDCIIATVTCKDKDGNVVKLTQQQWDSIKDAYAATIGETKGKDGNSFYIGNPPKDKNTQVKYKKLKFKDSISENGTGEFYIAPDYFDSEKPRTTTHTYFFKTNPDKHFCKMVCNITLSDATPEIAYSTTYTPEKDKGTSYEIARSWIDTAIPIIVLLSILGYIFKGKLPTAFSKNRIGYLVCIDGAKHVASKGPREKLSAWVNENVNAEPIKMSIKKNFLSVLVPFFPQSGTFRIENTDITEAINLKVLGTTMGRNEFVVVNNQDYFKKFSKEDIGVDNRGIVLELRERMHDGIDGVGALSKFKSKHKAEESDELKQIDDEGIKKERRWFAYVKTYSIPRIFEIERHVVNLNGYSGRHYREYEGVFGKTKVEIDNEMYE